MAKGNSNKAYSVGVTKEAYDQVSHVAALVGMSRSEFASMILTSTIKRLSEEQIQNMSIQMKELAKQREDTLVSLIT